MGEQKQPRLRIAVNQEVWKGLPVSERLKLRYVALRRRARIKPSRFVPKDRIYAFDPSKMLSKPVTWKPTGTPADHYNHTHWHMALYGELNFSRDQAHAMIRNITDA